MANPVSEAIALLQREGYEIVKREGLLRLCVQQAHPQHRWDNPEFNKDYAWSHNVNELGRYIFRNARHLLRNEVIYPDKERDPTGFLAGMALARTTLEFYPAQVAEFRR